MAGAILNVEWDTRQADLERIAQRLGNLNTPLSDIGDHLLESTWARFHNQVAPDGSPWAPLSPVTLARKKGPRILRETGALQDTIRYQVEGDELAVGTDRPYGAVQQHGQKRGASGTNRRGRPIPWGDIPARPYLGLSNEDETEILAIIGDYLMDAK